MRGHVLCATNQYMHINHRVARTGCGTLVISQSSVEEGQLLLERGASRTSWKGLQLLPLTNPLSLSPSHQTV